MAYTEELFPLQKGTFFRLQVHEREGFFIAEVYERDICHFSLLKDQNEITDKKPVLVIYSYYNDSVFIALKKGCRVLN